MVNCKTKTGEAGGTEGTEDDGEGRTREIKRSKMNEGCGCWSRAKVGELAAGKEAGIHFCPLVLAPPSRASSSPRFHRSTAQLSEGRREEDRGWW